MPQTQGSPRIPGIAPGCRNHRGPTDEPGPPGVSCRGGTPPRPQRQRQRRRALRCRGPSPELGAGGTELRLYLCAAAAPRCCSGLRRRAGAGPRWCPPAGGGARGWDGRRRLPLPLPPPLSHCARLPLPAGAALASSRPKAGSEPRLAQGGARPGRLRGEAAGSQAWG